MLPQQIINYIHYILKELLTLRLLPIFSMFSLEYHSKFVREKNVKFVRKIVAMQKFNY